MKLEEVLPAYRAGKAITRSGHKLFRSSDKESWRMMPEFLLAEDWLIVEDPITITREKLNKAWDTVNSNLDCNLRPSSNCRFLDEIWTELQKPTAREE